MTSIERIYPRLQRSALAITRSRDKAHDLTHYTIEFALTKCRSKIETMTDEKLYNYLARAQYIGYYSKTSGFNQIHRFPVADIDVQKVIDKPQEWYLHDRIRAEDVDTALSRLPEHERELMNEYFSGEMDYNTYAQLCGVDVSQLYFYVKHIKQKIKTHVVRIESNRRKKDGNL